MRGRLPRALALPLSAATVLLLATPAMAQPPPTTPIPEPGQPGDAPITSPPNPQPLGHAVGDAGAALGMLRLLPHAVETNTILPGFGEQLPKQALAEAGFGLSSAQANSEAYLAYEKSVAQSSPLGLALGGAAPQAPGSLVQTALPDNPDPLIGGFNAPQNPLLNVGLLNGSAHARWSEEQGPCVGTISDASTSVANISALNVIPTLPALPMSGVDLKKAKPDAEVTPEFDLQKGLETFGGLLGGGQGAKADGQGSLINLPNTLSSRSTVRLVDMPDSDRKAVESTSTLRMVDASLLGGLFSIKVVSQPTLRVTSTGDEATSKVDYTAPVLKIMSGDKEFYTLDAANPTAELPVGLPMKGLPEALGLPADQLKDAPIVGGLAQTMNGAVKSLTPDMQNMTLDLGVLKLSIAGLDQKNMPMTDPFKGFQLGASARLMDLQILPTEHLKKVLPQEFGDKLPSSLAQVTFGEQVARAYAPEGGVECGTATQPPPPAPPGGGEQPKGVPDQLAQTSAAYSSVPMFWTGTTLLLAGAVLVAALPGRRRDPEPVRVKPSPKPRE